MERGPVCVWKIREGTCRSFWAFTPCKPGFNYLSKATCIADIKPCYNNKKCSICGKPIRCDISLLEQ